MAAPSIQQSNALLAALQDQLLRLRVLVVDRHPNARNALRTMLSTLGVTQVHGASSAWETLRHVAKHEFGVIFSDYVLEDGRDGQQLLEELRHRHLIPLSTVFMIVTAERGYQHVASVAELTPDDYLIKPFTADQLQARLARALFKKKIFSAAYAALEKGDWAATVTACEAIVASQPAHAGEALRLQGETLNAAGRYADGEAVFRRVLADKPLPWARMGLAVALHARGAAEEAEALLSELLRDCPEYLAAYDFLARLQEERGDSATAQETLLEAGRIAPHNTQRQRLVGDVASRNGDLAQAERAYQNALARTRGSTLASADDYANLSKVLIEKGNVNAARQVIQDLKRERRGDKQAELASLVLESEACRKEGNEGGARKHLDQALALHDTLVAEGGHEAASRRLQVELAQACLAQGKDEEGGGLMKRLAAVHHDDPATLSHIRQAFEKAGKEEAGQALLAEVSQEIVTLNNRGVSAAQGGDLQASVDLLIQAAERVPNLQFLVNAANAIFTLLEHKGWQEEMALRGRRYLKLARERDPRSPKLFAAWEFYQRVGKKYGILVPPITAPDPEPQD